jgi:hypothetical protein
MTARESRTAWFNEARDWTAGILLATWPNVSSRIENAYGIYRIHELWLYLFFLLVFSLFFVRDKVYQVGILFLHKGITKDIAMAYRPDEI